MALSGLSQVLFTTISPHEINQVRLITVRTHSRFEYPTIYRGLRHKLTHPHTET